MNRGVNGKPRLRANSETGLSESYRNVVGERVGDRELVDSRRNKQRTDSKQ